MCAAQYAWYYGTVAFLGLPHGGSCETGTEPGWIHNVRDEDHYRACTAGWTRYFESGIDAWQPDVGCGHDGEQGVHLSYWVGISDPGQVASDYTFLAMDCQYDPARIGVTVTFEPTVTAVYPDDFASSA
jgi:hypothetical protein